MKSVAILLAGVIAATAFGDVKSTAPASGTDCPASLRPVQSPPIPRKTPVAPATKGRGVKDEASVCPYGFGASATKEEDSPAFGIPNAPGQLKQPKLGEVLAKAPRGEAKSTAEYEEAVQNLNIEDVQQDLIELFGKSDPRWPADYGNYGPLFIRLAWHCSGTFRVSDGRGGCSGGRQRFDNPDGINPGEASWPDNENLDKARMLLEPIKQKYGLGLSYGDLYILAGTTAIQWMQGPTLGVCLGRVDDVDGANSVALGPSALQVEIAPCGNNTATGQGNYNTKENPNGFSFNAPNDGDRTFNNDCTAKNDVTGANKVGLIYVNPEGVNGLSPDSSIPIDAASSPDEWKEQAEAVRRTFSRMGMSDEETVALIGGGHSFGKSHGACPLGGGISPFDAKQILRKEMQGKGKSEDEINAELDIKFRGGHDNYVDYSTPYGCAPGFEPKVKDNKPCAERLADCCVPQKAYIYQGECGEGVLKGKGPNAFTSGLEGPWTVNPTGWDNSYFTNLINYDWVKTKSPAGATQWKTACPGGRGCRAANDPGPVATGAFGGYEKIMMLTTDLVLVNDIGGFRKYVDKFAADSVAFDKVWANAWHKLTTVNFGTNSKPVCYSRGDKIVDSENGMYYGFSPNPLQQTKTECDTASMPNPSFGTYQTGVDDPSFAGQPKFDPSAMGGPAGY